MTHLEEKTEVLAVISVNTKLNRFDKVSISTEGGVINPKGTFMLTEKHLDNIADNCGASDGDMLKNAIASQLDDSYLEVHAVWCENGQPVLDEHGDPVLNDDGTPKVYDAKNGAGHWNVRNMTVNLGEDASQYISEINREIDFELAKEARLKKRKARNSRKTVTKKVTVGDSAEDTGSDTEPTI